MGSVVTDVVYVLVRGLNGGTVYWTGSVTEAHGFPVCTTWAIQAKRFRTPRAAYDAAGAVELMRDSTEWRVRKIRI